MSRRSVWRYDHSKSGPPIVPVDSATERERLIAANQAFAAALKQALRSGAETSGHRKPEIRAENRRYHRTRQSSATLDGLNFVSRSTGTVQTNRALQLISVSTSKWNIVSNVGLTGTLGLATA
jgi:hypothetical protein